MHVAIKTVLYLAVVLFGLEVGGSAFPPPGETGIEARDVLFSLAVSFVFVFMLDVNSLLGQNVLLNFATGRYYRPRLEERVFLFIDMENSTGLAERLGPLAFHRLLNRFVADLSDPIVAARGEIYSYVGDELIATWKLDRGIAEGRCVTACFDAMDKLTWSAPDYWREFGAAVNFRAGLHCGPVVTGEMGSVKREIVFLGDTVNTAARIQDFCRQTGERVLASADLIDRFELPQGVAKRSLGDLRLRGKGADISLYALTTGEEAASRSASVSREMGAVWLWRLWEQSRGIDAPATFRRATINCNDGRAALYLALDMELAMPSRRAAIWATATGAAIVVAGAAAAYWARPSVIWPIPVPSPVTERAPTPAAPAAQTSAAAAPPAVASAAVKPAFDVVSVDPTGEAVVAGRAAPHVRVELKDGGKTVAEATSDATGQFVMIPAPLPPGAHSLSLATGAGATLETSNTVAVAVAAPEPAPKAAPPAPQPPASASSPAPNTASSTLPAPQPPANAPSPAPKVASLALPSAARVAIQSIEATAGGGSSPGGWRSPTRWSVSMSAAPLSATPRPRRTAVGR